MVWQWKATDGNYYEVSNQHAAEIRTAFGDEWPSRDVCEDRRRYLVQLSSVRRLTSEETNQLRACDYIVNMYNAIRELNGRDYHEMFETIDQVHGNRLTVSCGCQLTYFFDHHLRTAAPNKIVHHPHHPHFVCETHKHLEGDFREHHRVVLAETIEANRRDS